MIQSRLTRHYYGHGTINIVDLVIMGKSNNQHARINALRMMTSFLQQQQQQAIPIINYTYIWDRKSASSPVVSINFCTDKCKPRLKSFGVWVLKCL